MWTTLVGRVAFALILSGQTEQGHLEKALPDGLRAERPWQRPECCGPNCLYVLLRCQGVKVELPELIRQLDPPSGGSSLEELNKAAERHGVQLVAMRTSPGVLGYLHYPFIAHMRYSAHQGHFLLVCASGATKVTVVDGTTLELRDISRAEFLRSWSGYVLANPRTPWEGGFLRAATVTGLVASAAVLLAGARKRRRDDEVAPEASHAPG